jgi:hypothetical protein
MLQLTVPQSKCGVQKIAVWRCIAGALPVQHMVCCRSHLSYNQAQVSLAVGLGLQDGT